ncbi:hypothetical protein SLEP1_g34319 [Rubroshorea leprosula]|uniref:Uncharacterized protein n=1 Tax=Rubroshorea leprosula TaxID=152421 RepID=A0AAV5KJP2_9ROSI|nr:hypothetical protein SLEP1_g34319 [Rubroshorea leprosula]
MGLGAECRGAAEYRLGCSRASRVQAIWCRARGSGAGAEQSWCRKQGRAQQSAGDLGAQNAGSAHDLVCRKARARVQQGAGSRAARKGA